MNVLSLLSKRSFLLFIVSGCLFVSGCSSIPMTVIETGNISTRDTIIEAEDGSFVFTAGEMFNSPYQNAQFKPLSTTSTTNNMRNFSASRQYIFGRPLVSQSAIALKAGAKPVRVTTPYLNKKLYGVLFLGMGVGRNTDLASKSYFIQVPKKYVDKALYGRMSVIYEPQETGLKMGDVPTWILWISDQKFY